MRYMIVKATQQITERKKNLYNTTSKINKLMVIKINLVNILFSKFINN